MALSQLKVVIAGEIISPTEWNNEIQQILNSSLALISPLTGQLNINGQTFLNTGVITFPTTAGTLARLNNTLGDFGATTSLQLLGVISDETGTGALVFGTSPTIAAPVLSGTTTGIYTLGGTPTITAPTIADFTNAAHDHGDADDAGAIVGAMATVRKTNTFATTSATFVDITDHTITFTTRARRVLLIFSGSASNNTANTTTKITLDVDGSNVGGSNGLSLSQSDTAGSPHACNVEFITDVLTAASHTFKVQMATPAGTSTLEGNPTSVFTAVEIPY